MPSTSQPSDRISSDELQKLNQIKSDKGPIFSLYLDPRHENALDRYNHLLREVEQRMRLEHAAHDYREQWAVEADQIRRWLETEKLPRQPGIALFSSLAAGLWKMFPLPVPICDQLFVGDRPHIRPLEILLREMKGDQQPQVESQRVEEVITRARKGEGAVLGADQTFLAVRSKTVRLLVVEEGYCLPGGECPNCGFLGSDERGVCLFCGMALRPEQDIVEVALKRVLEAGGDIEIVRSPETRSMLEKNGHIGGLVQSSGMPQVKETADQRPITKGGEINHDALHDETIEESFPASDPPGWNH